MDELAAILERKRVELVRRERHPRPTPAAPRLRPADVVAALRRRGAALPRVIAEIKRASPSAGVIRPRVTGDVAALAGSLARAGAAAVSVLADGPGFGGSALDVRRAAHAAAGTPVLFKEFVLGEAQVEVAAAVSASLVLLLARALDDAALSALCAACTERGLVPLVEAADARELDRALATAAPVVGVNARDLRTFRVDPAEARRLVERVPAGRVAVYMSGVTSREDLHALQRSRADAVLVGEGLMRAEDPAARLAEWLA